MKAEADSKSKGGGGRDIAQMTVGEWLQRQWIVVMCVSMGSCECTEQKQSQEPSNKTSLQAASQKLCPQHNWGAQVTQTQIQPPTLGHNSHTHLMCSN